MEIVVRRAGGFSGGGSVSTLDTGRLDSTRRQRVEQLVRDAVAGRANQEEPVGADLMRYEITLRENGRTQSLTWTDDGTPGPVRQLIEEVQELS